MSTLGIHQIDIYPARLYFQSCDKQHKAQRNFHSCENCSPSVPNGSSFCLFIVCVPVAPFFPKHFSVLVNYIIDSIAVSFTVFASFLSGEKCQL